MSPNWFFGKRRDQRQIRAILKSLELIIMQNQDLYAAITDLAAQTAKVKEEIVGKIAELETAVTTAQADGTVPEAVIAALAAVKSSVDALDAVVPDAPAPAPAPVDPAPVQ